jgi:MFS family permease
MLRNRRFGGSRGGPLRCAHHAGRAAPTWSQRQLPGGALGSVARRGGSIGAVTDAPEEPRSNGAGATHRSLIGRLRRLDPNVRSLGLVSFFADFSSEIVYPLFPIFITSVLGAPAAVLGLIEGIAEGTANITRYPFGQWSDYIGRRRVFASAGYGLAAAGKLLLAVAFVWPVALLGRFVDRLGKGMRTAPRDALIAAGTPPEQRGIAFGLHRSMDTLGAVVGPLIALLLIELHVPIRWVFAVAVVPGILSVGVIALFVREHTQPRGQTDFKPRLPASLAFRWLLASSLLFSLGNSSDMFILLKAKSVIHSPSATVITAGVILLYVLYNVTYSAVSLPAGNLSDRIGQVPLVLGGYVVFALVYAGFAAAGSWPWLAGLFAFYGVYIAATEGTSKALISRAIPKQEHGSGLGLYYTATGVASFAASTLGGVLWSAVGPWATFTYGAAFALLAAAVLGVAHRRGVEAAIGD